MLHPQHTGFRELKSTQTTLTKAVGIWHMVHELLFTHHPCVSPKELQDQKELLLSCRTELEH